MICLHNVVPRHTFVIGINASIVARGQPDPKMGILLVLQWIVERFSPEELPKGNC